MNFFLVLAISLFVSIQSPASEVERCKDKVKFAALILHELKSQGAQVTDLNVDSTKISEIILSKNLSEASIDYGYAEDDILYQTKITFGVLKVEYGASFGSNEFGDMFNIDLEIKTNIESGEVRCHVTSMKPNADYIFKKIIKENGLY
ncbi:hypothetical protein N9O57_00510 [bacterium]|nr:hypothetical protein [bacterium]